MKKKSPQPKSSSALQNQPMSTLLLVTTKTVQSPKYRIYATLQSLTIISDSD
jgi:hypothetical protein